MIHRNSNLEPAEMSYFRLNLLSFLRDTPTKRTTFHLLQGVAIWQQKHIAKP